MQITKEQAIERLRLRRIAGTLKQIAEAAGKSLPTIRDWDLKDQLQRLESKETK